MSNISTTEEALEAIKERFRSPIIGNFTISFLITNWKIPYVTFFVSEAKFPYQTKIDVILDIISSYGNCWAWQFLYLFAIPASWVCFIVLLYPIIQSYVQKIRIDNEAKTRIHKLEKDREFINKKDQYTLLQKQHEQLVNNTSNELKIRIIKDAISTDKILIGNWKVEFISNLSEIEYTHYDDCYFTKSECISRDKGILFRFPLIIPESENLNIHNFNIKFKIDFIHNSFPKEHYTFRIDNRCKMVLYYNDYTIKLTMQSVN